MLTTITDPRFSAISDWEAIAPNPIAFIIYLMFFIVHDDKPIYELIFSQSEKQIKEYFLVHSALDTIDHMLKNRKEYYLGQLRTDDLAMYGYVSPVGLKLMLVLGSRKEHDKAVDKAIREYFQKVAEALAVALLNPLYQYKSQIRSALFDERVRSYAKEHLRAILLVTKK